MKTKNIIYGVLLIILSVLLILDVMSLINFNIFFDGWWTLFIIIPAIIGLISGKLTFSNLILLIIGVSLLLRYYIKFPIFRWEFVLAMILLLVGINMILSNVKNSTRSNYKYKFNNMDSNNYSNDNIKSSVIYNVVFGERTEKFHPNINNIKALAIFGGIDIKGKSGDITSDCYIKCTCIFGGIDINLPENVNVVVKGTPFCGMVSLNRSTIVNENNPTVYIDYYCIFGGIDID